MSSTLDPAITNNLQQQALAGANAAELLRYLVLEQKIEEQIVLMEYFCAAFDINLGAVTAIGAWWHEGERELDDEALNAYIQWVVDDYRKSTAQ